MKLSKILGWFGQLFALIYAAIVSAKNEILNALGAYQASSEKLIDGVSEKVSAEAGKTNSAIAATAEAVIAVKGTVDDNRKATDEQFKTVNDKLEQLATTENEDELRKALEVTLPKEVLEGFKW